MTRARTMLATLAMAMLVLSGCTEYSRTLVGDLNGDGHLSQADIKILQALIENGSVDEGDLNKDGKVDTADLDLLYDLVCQENGGELDPDGNCCTLAADGTVCCDETFDGDFNDCQAPDTDCEDVSDCEHLSCPSICTAAGKCRCQGMCDEDEDCQVLNCPAFCNDNNECQCKIPCDDNQDCAWIDRCPSICDAALGYCICQPEDCREEGEVIELDDNSSVCCIGLTRLINMVEVGGECVEGGEHPGYICTYCGNGQCGPGENRCNCPVDCAECQPGETLEHTCPDGTQVTMCTCSSDLEWICVPDQELCKPECHAEGERFVDYQGTQQCCPGLSKIEDAVLGDLVDGEPLCELYCDYGVSQCFICLACGDGICDPAENPCTCPADCPVPLCAPGEVRTWTCADGSEVPWCECDPLIGDWACIDSPESQCGQDCRVLGEHFMDFEGNQVCCDGLTRADDCAPWVNQGEIVCECPDCPCFVCVLCGDGHCGEGENLCTCPQDCPQPECNPGETIPCYCDNHYENDPPCFECNDAGQWQPIAYFEDPCMCYAWTGCENGYVCDTVSGRCEPDCRIALTCPPGHACDEQTGLCLPECLGAGEIFEGSDTEGVCCPGLVPVPELYPDAANGFCTGPNCLCHVCTACGTDQGTCSEGENVCNCPQDCVEVDDCPIDSCMMDMNGTWMIESGDCPGLPGDQTMHYPIEQPDCSVIFHGLISDVLGPRGCMDVFTVYTSNGCVGTALPTALVRFEFVCPVPVGNSNTCRMTIVMVDS